MHSKNNNQRTQRPTTTTTTEATARAAKKQTEIKWNEMLQEQTNKNKKSKEEPSREQRKWLSRVRQWCGCWGSDSGWCSWFWWWLWWGTWSNKLHLSICDSWGQMSLTKATTGGSGRGGSGGGPLPRVTPHKLLVLNTRKEELEKSDANFNH